MGPAYGGSAAAADHLGSVVDGRAGHDGVRAVLTQPLEHGVAGLLDARLPVARPRTLRLLRSKYKPGRKITGYYSVADGAALARHHLAVAWTADGDVRVLVSPADPALPQLRRLTDVAGLGRLLEELSGGDRRAGGLTISTLRYRPGQRHVLRARSSVGPAVYVKVDRDGSGARAVPVAELLGEVFVRDSPGARVVEPIGFAPAEQAALWWEAPGRGLASLVSAGTAAASAVETAGRSVRAIHDSPTSSAGHPALAAAGVRTLEDEVTVTLRAGEHIAALMPSTGLTYAHVVDDVVTGLDRLPPEAPTFTHGDLKADNMLVDGGRLHVLDLDRACWTDPAMDIGKFLADLRWWSGTRHVASTLEAAFRAGYGECDRARWQRADLFATLVMVRFAARRCVVHDSDWPTRVSAQLIRAVEPLIAPRSRRCHGP